MSGITMRDAVAYAIKVKADLIEADLVKAMRNLNRFQRFTLRTLRWTWGLEAAFRTDGAYLGVKRHGKWLIGDGVTPRHK